MCGINGVFHYGEDVRADVGLVERQAQMMQHRGPDDHGLWSEGPVALGHRRLSIVDLSPGGHQPMPNEDESLWVTYNGELYEWPALRSVLASLGHRVRGTSDTEALLHLYEEHGDEMLHHLRGMWAFGLFDRKRQRLLVARDRMGIKPLYYHDDGRRLAFASELKALLLDPRVARDVDPEALADYLVFQYVPCPRSILKGIRKLPPGHALTCDRNGVQVRPYWTLPVTPDPGRSEDYYRERLRGLLKESVRMRMIADVPLGAFLSGGVDSSVVVALMHKVAQEPIKTFSIGFADEKENDEREHARRVAKHLGTDHREFVVRIDALEILPRLVWQCDEPFADASMIPTYYVSEMARQHVTVALSGDGGDESFGGYVTYPWARRYARWDSVPHGLRRLAAKGTRWMPEENVIARRLRRLGATVVDRHLEAVSFFLPRELWTLADDRMREVLRGHDPYAASRAFHARAAAAVGDIPALLHLDAVTYMPDDVLMKVDKTSMLCSLEVRVPFLDFKVQEFVSQIPFEYKLRGDVGKWILRACVSDLLPPETLAREKRGFGPPVDQWLRSDLGHLAREVLTDPRARGRGWFDPRRVDELIAGHGRREERRARQLWALLCLELWAQTFLDRSREEIVLPLAPAEASRIA